MMYRVKVEGEEKTYPEETKLIEIAKEYQKTRDHDIVLAMVDYKLSELGKNIENGSRISFLTTDFCSLYSGIPYISTPPGVCSASKTVTA